PEKSNGPPPAEPPLSATRTYNLPPFLMTLDDLADKKNQLDPKNLRVTKEFSKTLDGPPIDARLRDHYELTPIWPLDVDSRETDPRTIARDATFVWGPGRDQITITVVLQTWLELGPPPKLHLGKYKANVTLSWSWKPCQSAASILPKPKPRPK